MKNAPLLLLILFLLPFKSYAQIGEEILTYVDSTELVVQNGRKMMFKELNDSNLNKVKEIYDYLTEATAQKHSAAFYYIEDFFINVLTGDWRAVNNLMLTFDDYASRYVYPNTQDLVPKLYEMITNGRESVLSGSRRSQMDEEAKMLVEVYLAYLKTGSSGEEYNAMLTAYKKKYNNPKYEGFVKGFLPARIIKASWSFAMGSGMLYPTRDLAANFSNNAVFQFAMDFNVDRVFTSLYLNATNLKLKEPFTAISSYDTLNFELDEKFTYMDAGLKAGYFLIRSQRFHIAPYVSISGSFLESMRYDDPEDNELEYEVFNSFTYGGGLHTAVKIFEFENRNMYYGATNSHLGIKLEAGINKMAKFKDPYAVGDMPYITCALVWGFGQF